MWVNVRYAHRTPREINKAYVCGLALLLPSLAPHAPPLALQGRRLARQAAAPHAAPDAVCGRSSPAAEAEPSESSPAPFPLRLRCGVIPIRAPPLTRLGRLLPCSGSSPAAATVSSEPPTFSTRGSAPAKAEPPVAPTGTNRLVQTRRSALPFVFYAPSTHPGPIAALQCVFQKRRQRQQLPHNPPQYAMETAGRRSRTRGANERHWLSR